MATKSKRVLVVEDSPVMREMFRLTFKDRSDVRLDDAPDGVAALQAIRCSERAYNLILLDLNMPVMDGMRFLERLRNETSCAASVVAVVTTEASRESERQARRLGASYFLRKPVTRKQINMVISAVLD